MKRASLVGLQGIIVMVGIATFALMLWEPHLEGRNADATLFEIYFRDPFLAYVYASSILFFMALYEAFTFLGYIRKGELFSLYSQSALRRIRRYIMTLILLVLGAEAYIFLFQRGKEDIAGGVAIGLFMMLILSVIAILTSVFEWYVQKNLPLHR
jgi:hypothetical protein